MKYTTVSDPKLPKKHDTVNHFGPSKMVLELTSVRQSFPNNLIYQRNENKCNVYTIHYTSCTMNYCTIPYKVHCAMYISCDIHIYTHIVVR